MYSGHGISEVSDAITVVWRRGEDVIRDRKPVKTGACRLGPAAAGKGGGVVMDGEYCVHTGLTGG